MNERRASTGFRRTRAQGQPAAGDSRQMRFSLNSGQASAVYIRPCLGGDTVVLPKSSRQDEECARNPHRIPSEYPPEFRPIPCLAPALPHAIPSIVPNRTFGHSLGPQQYVLPVSNGVTNARSGRTQESPHVIVGSCGEQASRPARAFGRIEKAAQWPKNLIDPLTL